MDIAVPSRRFAAEMIIVAGGGLAGAAAATSLAQAGRDVMLIEREILPHNKICGDFLSTEAQSYLLNLGLDPASLGGHPISHVRLVRGRKIVAHRLPFTGLGLSRKILDEALLQHAAASGAVLRRGLVIRQISADPGIKLSVSDLGELTPETFFLATGKHDLRGAKRDFAPPDLAGFKMYFALSPEQTSALAGHVELILFAGGYAGLQLVENNRANLCLLVSTTRLKRAGGAWGSLLDDLCTEAPHLATRLDGATELLAAPLTIARVPYGYIHPATERRQNLFRLGDQAAVIHSFTGDGMAMALHSAARATACLRRGQTAADYHRQLAQDVAGQMKTAGILYKLLQNPGAQPALFGAAKLFPPLLAAAARLTRVPETARLSC
jgi:flavin-dependent dehydrogenase